MISSASGAPAGQVTFTVHNDGGFPHDLLVIRTEQPPAELPIDQQRAAIDEAQVQVVGTTGVLDDGQSATLLVGMAPGRYVLVCNVPTHYQSGMRTSFVVQ